MEGITHNTCDFSLETHFGAPHHAVILYILTYLASKRRSHRPTRQRARAEVPVAFRSRILLGWLANRAALGLASLELPVTDIESGNGALLAELMQLVLLMSANAAFQHHDENPRKYSRQVHLDLHEAKDVPVEKSKMVQWSS